MKRLLDYCTRLWGMCIYVVAFLFTGSMVACGARKEAKNQDVPPPSSDREEGLRPMLMYGTPYKTYDAHNIGGDSLHTEVPTKRVAEE